MAGEIVPDGPIFRNGKPLNQDSIAEIVPDSPIQRATPIGMGEAAGRTEIALSPIALGMAFLLINAIAIRSRPQVNRSTASLSGWTRIVIVLMFLWSALVTGFVIMMEAEMTPQSTWPLVYLTYGPITAVWLLYFAIRWIRAGFAD